ncbi:uncharacterized protein LOC126381819 [Pectinophora gossypiella]|uniref:uncharacterized protein LOC126381819 n=1 Tax=Pectinophora gossypiella TaxID=13191 RepID=UPI00214E663F|nr:uncharacterized protein LOC126381819 [Pectinophora gossypiella]XP_049887273.1 uncharacterized protein LOC126381819 [Pectinophora gossypiella]
MDMVKVDPKMFVTCRLCLENMGMYQITPVVQQQVKYCFDIDVDPFDGLPQLICKSCETILTEYHTKKRIFIGRQNALKAKLAVRQEVEEESRESPHQEAVSSSHQDNNENPEPRPNEHTTAKKRFARILSTSSSSDIDRNDSPSVAISKKKQMKRKKTSELWKKTYSQMFSCNLCGNHNKYLKSRNSLRKHMKKHRNLVSQFENIINRPCILNITKIDGKANKTGSSDAVVISQDKIIGPERDNTYNTIYCAKEEKSNVIPNDDGAIKGTVRKRRRLLSESSTDTVVLDGNNSHGTSNIQLTVNKETELECINIDDSSNSSATTSIKGHTNYIQLQEADKKTIDNLIKVSHNRYMLRKHETVDNENKPKDLPLIKHKLLSMGRKVINKQGMACTGLLRFIERQNLEIKWIPTNPQKNTGSSDGKFVRIMPRLKGKEDLSPDRSGWKYVLDPPEMKSVAVNNTKNKGNKPVRTVNQKPQTEVTLNKTEPERLYEDTYHITESDRKLLNANPVANPKQLPKKLNTTDSKIILKSVAVAVPKAAVVPNAVVLPNTFVVNNPEGHSSFCVLDRSPDKETCMPIITSTTSLAIPSLPAPPMEQNNGNKLNGDKTSNTANAVEVDKPAPRIKVKPFTELMSERALQFIGQNQDTKTSTPSVGVWKQDAPSGGPWQPGGKIAPSIKPNNQNQMATLTDVSTGTPLPIKSNPAPVPLHAVNRGLVRLDSVELPNTTTDSPFKYVKNLLQIHNINLLSSDQPVPQHFACLIKFKLMFLRETVKTPVTLSLSIYCSGNNFSLIVKDSTQLTNLDLSKLTATWQWEILKTFVTREDIIQKMTHSAQRIGQQEHEHTKGFLCVLKSIKYTAIS